jgi:hypothetical protein
MLLSIDLHCPFYVVIQILGALFFILIFQFSNLQSVIFAIVKRKRTQALLGSNLLAILFTDTLYKGRF